MQRLYGCVRPGVTFAACPPDHNHPVVAITVLQLNHDNAMARCRWRNRWGGEEARWLLAGFALMIGLITTRTRSATMMLAALGLLFQIGVGVLLAMALMRLLA